MIATIRRKCFNHATQKVDAEWTLFLETQGMGGGNEMLDVIATDSKKRAREILIGWGVPKKRRIEWSRIQDEHSLTIHFISFLTKLKGAT